MRFRTRAFLLSFVPFAVLLTVSFFIAQHLVESAVRDGLRSSLRQNHQAVARIHSKSDLQNSRFLKVVGENSSLKAGMQLLLSMPDSVEAKSTVEDQLREMCDEMGFPLLLVSNGDGRAMAGVIREKDQAISLDVSTLQAMSRGLLSIHREAYQVASVPVNQGRENLGSLSIGQPFDFAEFTTPAVLIQNGHVLKSSIPDVTLAEVEAALVGCGANAECDVHLRDAAYVSLPMRNTLPEDGYALRTLQNVDLAIGPVKAMLHRVFLTVALGIGLLTLLVTAASSRSLVRPIAGLAARLRNTEQTGLLSQLHVKPSSIREIRELNDSFNRAAAAISDGRRHLHDAYVEFVESLANALDARDCYTAGHSNRVSELSLATALAMGLSSADAEKTRVGALLHDIGKIGIADRVLQKPGKLTDAEFALVKQHPGIGRRILEGVQGFTAYLDAVELHHENWDGTGYPHGQRGEQTALEARIIHVSDAYDAMTTDRPYRNGMSQERAIQILRAMAGTQFDPHVVEAFCHLPLFAHMAREVAA